MAHKQSNSRPIFALNDFLNFKSAGLLWCLLSSEHDFKTTDPFWPSATEGDAFEIRYVCYCSLNAEDAEEIFNTLSSVLVGYIPLTQIRSVYLKPYVRVRDDDVSSFDTTGEW